MTMTLLSELTTAFFRIFRGRAGGSRRREERERDDDFLDFVHRDQGALLEAELASFDGLAHGFRR